MVMQLSAEEVLRRQAAAEEAGYYRDVQVPVPANQLVTFVFTPDGACKPYVYVLEPEDVSGIWINSVVNQHLEQLQQTVPAAVFDWAMLELSWLQKGDELRVQVSSDQPTVVTLRFWWELLPK